MKASGSSNWKVVTIVVVAVFVSSIVFGLACTQPWSRIRVTICNPNLHGMIVNAEVDGMFKRMNAAIQPNETIVIGLWAVNMGVHEVTMTWGVLPRLPGGIGQSHMDCTVGPLEDKTVSFSVPPFEHNPWA